MRRTFARILSVVLLAAAQLAAAAGPTTELIASYYRSILGREPDAAGLAFWESQATQSVTLGASENETFRLLAMQFFESAEFRALGTSNAEFVTRLYRTVLEREPDAAGLGYWAGQVQSGLPREAVTVNFVFAAEFDLQMVTRFGVHSARPEVGIVIDLYRSYLNRIPDAEGFRYWRDRLRGAQCAGAADVNATVDDLSRQFMFGAEYVARRRNNSQRVSDLYGAFLRRGADLDGVLYWKERLDSGARTLDYLRQQFLNSAEFQARVTEVVAAGCAKLADRSELALGAIATGPSPFIAQVSLAGANLDRVLEATFEIAPRAGSVSRPVRVTQGAASLARRGFGATAGGFTLPLFGLYAGRSNSVALDLAFDDGSVRRLALVVPTAAWTDARGRPDVFLAPQVFQARAPGVALGFDFFNLKTSLTGPIVMDSDGEVRWWAPSATASHSHALDGEAFLIGPQSGMTFERLRWDGGSTFLTVARGDNPHHNVEPGKSGWLVEIDETVDGVANLENVLLEVDAAGAILKTWDFGALISAHMAAGGDDPARFVRPGVDWFHMNSAIYDARDDSIIASSREQFVIKVDYATGAIRWILGDPTKHWHAFPSLREKALALEAGAAVPIGQHALSITADGLLMMFNNGAPSFNQPPGEPAGAQRAESLLSAYEIDPVAMTAREMLRYSATPPIASPFCSSVYEVGDSLLVNYSTAEGILRSRVMGLDAARAVAFDYQFAHPAPGCFASWNAAPVPLEGLVLR